MSGDATACLTQNTILTKYLGANGYTLWRRFTSLPTIQTIKKLGNFAVFVQIILPRVCVIAGRVTYCTLSDILMLLLAYSIRFVLDEQTL